MRTVTVYTKLDSDEHKELGERTGSMKLPRAFIGAIPLGSNHEIAAADQSGISPTCSSTERDLNG